MSYYQTTTFNPYLQYSMYPMYNWGYNQPMFMGLPNNTALPLVQQQAQQPQINTTNLDSVTFSANKQIQQQKKEGLSTGAKWAIGIGATTALAVGADFLFCKGKHVKSLWGKVKGNNSKPDGTPPSPPTSNPPAPPKKPNFFEQKGLKVNKEIVSNADGTLYTGTLEKVNKNGEKFVLEYKDGVLQSSKKYTNAGDYVSCKKYTREIDNRIGSDRKPYQVKKRIMYVYDNNDKIIGGAYVAESKNSTIYVNNKYCIVKNDKGITKRRFATKDGKKYVLFERPLDTECMAKSKLGMASGEALSSPFVTCYPLPK